MINNIYAKAYTEVIEILKYFPKEDFDKIPLEKIEFYKNNMDKNYSFIIKPEISLEEQNISSEANAIIINLYVNYLATEEQKIEIKKILNLNQEKEEIEKRKKYSPDDLFEKNYTENQTNNMLVEYRKPLLKKIKDFIFKILKIHKEQ